MAIHNRYEVVDRPTTIQKREIALSDQSSPKDKPKPHLEEVYRDRHQQVYEEVDQLFY
jgi:hypothetical protein